MIKLFKQKVNMNKYIKYSFVMLLLPISSYAMEENNVFSVPTGSLVIGYSECTLVLDGAVEQNISEMPEELDEVKKCSICCEKLNEHEDSETTECKHSFHLECLRIWKAISRMCLICKKSI